MNLNIVRGRGLFCQFIMQRQAILTENTDIYACLVATINCDVSIFNLFYNKMYVY